MNIIIAGGGRVGSTLARQLSAEGCDLTLIDSDDRVLRSSMERYDMIGILGNCASMEVLEQAHVDDADLLIAATDADEVNLLCCTIAHALNPKLHTIARIRNPEYGQQIYQLRDVFGLSMAINPEKQAATEIDRLLKYPGFLRRDVFARGRTEIVELRIDATSKLCNVSLFQLSSIIKCRVLVCAVLRDGTALVPRGDFILKEGDRIFATAPSRDLTTLLRSLGIITRRIRKVMLCGGGHVSHYLAALLEERGIETKLIDSDLERCQELTELLPDTAIAHGDCGDLEVLESEGLSDRDALVALTGSDELNMIISLYATSKGVPQVITRLADTTNRGILDALKLGSVICPKELCCNDIVRYVRAMQNQTGAAISVHAIADGQVEAMEFLVDDSCDHCGIPLRSLKTRPNVLIASITHGARTEIPNGDSVFHKGDTLVVVTSGRGVLKQMSDIFD
ncbi:MAG: Trk system potassium transporter TrkA [Oscillospiraceae bacterium]|nr:Trk system potassium transporter TrkA [Oscillospiraceae bacterium]